MTAVSTSGMSERANLRHDTDVPRILVVSPVAPVPQGVGGVYLRDLCLMYPADRLAFAILPGIGTGAWPDALAAAPRTTSPITPTPP